MTLNFFHENLQNIMGDLFENFDVSLGTKASCICLLKCQENCAISVPFNVIEMV